MSDDASTISQRIEELQAHVARATKTEQQLLADNAKLARERDEYKKLVRLLEEANEKLKRGLLGQKAERLPSGDAQLSLAMLRLALGMPEDAPPPDPDEEQVVEEHTRRKPVRKPFPDHLPRVEIEMLPEEAKREGLDAFERIGQDARDLALPLRGCHGRAGAGQGEVPSADDTTSPSALEADARALVEPDALELAFELGVRDLDAHLRQVEVAQLAAPGGLRG